jgi:hypothetical protein
MDWEDIKELAKLMGAFLLIVAIVIGLGWGAYELLVADPGTERVIEESNIFAVKIAPDIWRVVDYDAQVVCYENGDGGIDCMPISDTALPRE